MRINKIVLFTIIVIISNTLSYANNYFIDNDAKGNDTGTNWANAWRSFSQIQWGTISPGDTIFISGGNNSKTYNELLEIDNKSGTNELPILITKGTTTGHNGTVIINGQDVRDSSIIIEDSSYIKISELELINCIGKGAIYIDRCEGIIVDNLDIEIHGHGGVYILDSKNCIIRNNSMSTYSGYEDAQNDGIYAQNNLNNIYEYNHIIITNQNIDRHNDCIQMYLEDSPIVRGNYLEQRNSKTSNAQGIYGTMGRGLYKIYNNVVYCLKTESNLIGYRNLTTGTANVEVYNNTIIGNSPNMIRVSGQNSKIKNNIVVKNGDNYAIRIEDELNNLNNVDYNLIYIKNGGNIVYYDADGEGKTASEWQQMGAEEHGKFVDPALNVNLFPLEDSPCINAGIDLSGIFTTDKDGITRPSNNWDIGAYEYYPNHDLLFPSPKNIRIKK